MEVLPSFPGGITKFYTYFKSNLKLSESERDEYKMIIVSFLVEKDGSLSSFEFVKKSNEKLNDMAAEVLKTSPKWIPGENKGEIVRVLYSLPIRLN